MPGMDSGATESNVGARVASYNVKWKKSLDQASSASPAWLTRKRSVPRQLGPPLVRLAHGGRRHLINVAVRNSAAVAMR